MSKYKKFIEPTCLICGFSFDTGKRLTNHVSKVHNLSSKDYTIKHIYGGTAPKCLACDNEPRYVALKFKRYCMNHAHVAESEAGRVGGTIKKTWSKGLTKEMDQRLSKFAMKMSGSNNPFYGKKHSEETKKRNADAHRLQFDEVRKRFEAKGDIVVVGTIDKLTYSTHDDPIDVKCLVCQTIQSVSLHNYNRSWRCKTCFPIGSRQQLEVVDFIKSLGFDDVEVSTRSVIPPYELDVWVPSKNFAVEYHGLYWHSGGKDGVFDKKRHREKFLEAQKKQIKLFQFFSDEWIERNDVCKSMIKNALGVNDLKLNARDCEIREIHQKQSKEFLNNNHIAGATRAKVHFGLIHPKHGLVSVATVRTPIQKKWGNVTELARMCSLTNTSVRGGASKLLLHVCAWARSHGYDGLLSYAELRYGTGNVYEIAGLELMNVALNNYWYSDGQKRYDRFAYRAQPGKTEKQVAEENNVRPVYGCGNNIYLVKFDTKLSDDLNVSTVQDVPA